MRKIELERSKEKKDQYEYRWETFWWWGIT